jgi:hypothetical protein
LATITFEGVPTTIGATLNSSKSGDDYVTTIQVGFWSVIGLKEKLATDADCNDELPIRCHQNVTFKETWSDNWGNIPSFTVTATTAYVQRYLHGGYWNTLCFPFDLTAAQLATAFGTYGTDFKIAQFSGADGNALSFTGITSSGNLTAYKPYLIWVKSDKSYTGDDTNLSFDNVTLNKSDASMSVKYGDFQFVATMNQTSVPTDPQGYFIRQNKVYKANSKSKVPGMGCYLQYAGEGEAPAREFSVFVDGETTGLKFITNQDTSTSNTVIYNLAGQRVEGKTNGVYVKNGKKYIVK